MKKRLMILLVSLLVCQGGALARQALTNADVVKMVKAGLSPDLIAATVRQAPAKSFDMSPDALIKLKTDGVRDVVIAAMVGGPAPNASSTAASNTITIPDGTEVRLRLAQRLSSASAKVNDRVRLEVVEQVVVGSQVVIAKGSEATGNVTEASPKKSFGRSGKLNFTIDAVKALDGTNIRLRAARDNKGSESYGKAGVVTILAGPFGALVKGKDVELEPGTEYSIYIDGDRVIKLGGTM